MAINASVTSATAESVLVDIEVYGPTGAKVYQEYFDSQVLAAGETRSYPITWAIPGNAATGTYRVKIGIFSPGWGTLYEWNDSASQFSVRRS